METAAFDRFNRSDPTDSRNFARRNCVKERLSLFSEFHYPPHREEDLLREFGDLYQPAWTGVTPSDRRNAIDIL